MNLAKSLEEPAEEFCGGAIGREIKFFGPYSHDRTYDPLNYASARLPRREDKVTKREEPKIVIDSLRRIYQSLIDMLRS